MILTFIADDKLIKTLDQLSGHYGVPREQVFRRALALLRVASTVEHDDGSINLVEPDGNILKLTATKAH